jgi:hypothetical protein
LEGYYCAGFLVFSAVAAFCVRFGLPVGGNGVKQTAVQLEGVEQDAWWPRIVAAEQPNKNYDDNHQAPLLREYLERTVCHRIQTAPTRTKHNKIRGLLAFRHCFGHNSRRQNAARRHFDLTYCGHLAKPSSGAV